MVTESYFDFVIQFWVFHRESLNCSAIFCQASFMVQYSCVCRHEGDFPQHYSLCNDSIKTSFTTINNFIELFLIVVITCLALQFVVWYSPVVNHRLFLRNDLNFLLANWAPLSKTGTSEKARRAKVERKVPIVSSAVARVRDIAFHTLWLWMSYNKQIFAHQSCSVVSMYTHP